VYFLFILHQPGGESIHNQITLNISRPFLKYEGIQITEYMFLSIDNGSVVEKMNLCFIENEFKGTDAAIFE
jgi:hypothetical protein